MWGAISKKLVTPDTAPWVRDCPVRKHAARLQWHKACKSEIGWADWIRNRPLFRPHKRMQPHPTYSRN